MPIYRHTSNNVVPVSANFNANTICSSVNLYFSIIKFFLYLNGILIE